MMDGHLTGDISGLLCVEVLAEWLERELTHAELAEEVERLFLRDGPALSRRIRLDLRRFLQDRSSRTLAECLAMNEEPAGRAAFVAWCREMTVEVDESYRYFGVEKGEFCAERGPGRAAGV